MNRKDILDTAEKCVNGARQQDYGNPEDNFKKIGELWTAYTGHEYSPVDVAMMLLLMKVGRMTTGKGTADTYVDICGYAACAGEIATGGDTLIIKQQNSRFGITKEQETDDVSDRNAIFDVNL